MSTSTKSKKSAGLFQLTPFLIFISTFFLLSKLFPQIDSAKTDDFPLFSCMLAVIWALFTFKEKLSLNKKMEIFVSGAANPTIMYICFIFIGSSIFAHFLTMTHGVHAVIDLCLKAIPQSLLLPGIFLTTSLFSLIIGSSMGCITTFMPIAMGFSNVLHINPALLAGIVVGGSMLGDNLSVISDTTIAAAKATGCSMKDKFKGNGLLVLPAFIITMIILFIINTTIAQTITIPTIECSISMFIKIIPYLIVITMALIGIDVLAVIFIGSLSAGIIGILDGSFSVSTALTEIFDGFYAEKKMVAVLVLVLLIAGLSKMIEANGGIKYILSKLNKKIKTTAQAEFTIAILVFLINSVIVINTIAILITGPMAKKIGDDFNIKPSRIASLLDIFACVCQGIMPYAPQLLLAGALAKVSSVAIMPYLHYQYLIFIVGILSIIRTKINQPKAPFL